MKRHPEFRGPERDYRIIRGRTTIIEDDITTILVRVTAAVSLDLDAYDPAEDVDLYEEFLMEKEPLPRRIPCKIWIEQCDAAPRIEADWGTEKALGYLIGEKLPNFLEVAESKPEWRAEVPAFIAKIKETFEPWQIAEFFKTPRRLGALGHATDDEGHKKLRSTLDDSAKLRVDTRNLLLLEWARDLLMGDGRAAADD